MQQFLTRFLSTIIFTVCCYLPVAAQSNFDDNRFSELRVHFDKRYFLPGESLFFTVYNLSADTMPGKSCTLVLMDENNNAVSVKRLLLNTPVASSYFVLPSIDTAKFYSVQYYTSSYSKPVIYSKYFFSALSMPGTRQHDNSNPPSVQFFPEGNNIVKGLPVVLYCRFSNISRSSFPLDAVVVNAAGDTLQNITTTASGNARLELTEEDDGAKFLLYNVHGKNYRHPITINYSAYNKAIMNVYPVTDAFVYRIRTLINDSFFVKIEHEGMKYYQAAMFLKAGDDLAKAIKLSQLRSGRNIISLFGVDGTEIAVRTFYVEETVSSNPVISNVTKKDTGISVNFSEKITGRFSVSVQRFGKVKVDAEETIADKRAVDDIDLQATNMSNEWIAPLREDSLYITLTDDKTGNFFADEPVNLVVSSGGDHFILPKKSDSKGQVFISSDAFTDSATIVVFPGNKEKLKQPVTAVYKPLPVFTDNAPHNSFFLNDIAQSYIDTGNDVTRLSLDIFKGKILKEVVVKTKARYATKVDSVEQVYASGMYQSRVHNVARFDLINDYQTQAFGDVASFLSGRIAKKSYGRTSMSSALDGYNVYLNESLIDATMASTINMSDVAFISVMGNNFVGMSSFGASILIYTKKGSNANAVVQRDGVKRNVLKIKWYASGSDYFNSLFDEKKVDNVFRNTLYWNDNVMIDGKTELNLPLLTKVTGVIKITVTGFDNNGNYLSLEKIVK